MTTQLPNESAKAFAAFLAYCEQGENRSLSALSRALSKSIPLLKVWSKRHKWVLRSREWDANTNARLQAARDKAMKAEAEIWAERQATFRTKQWGKAETLLSKVEEMLKFPVGKTKTVDGKTIIEPAKWSMGDASKMLDLALKLQALALGLATDKTEHVGTMTVQSNPDINHLTLDQLNTLESLLTTPNGRIDTKAKS